MAYIRLQNVTVTYPIYNFSSQNLRNQMVNIATGGTLCQESRKQTLITGLDNITLDLQEGDTVGLIGHNGAGKTTLLRTMAGIFLPSKGTVSLSGQISTIIELGGGLEPELTGYENIFRMGLLFGFSRERMAAEMDDIERFTELGNFLNMPVRTYSSGMMMRLMFAVATAHKPEILLIDEMFSTGDSSFQDKAKQRMLGLMHHAKIFVFASHDHNLLKSFCKKLVTLEHGRIVDITK